MNFQEYLVQQGVIEKPTDRSLNQRKKKNVGTRQTEEPSKDLDFHVNHRNDLYELSFETEAMTRQVSKLLDSWLMPHTTEGTVISFDSKQVFEAAKNATNL